MTRDEIGELWTGQYMTSVRWTWLQIQNLPVDWRRISELCLQVSNDGGFHTPLMVRLDQSPARLANGHHRYWVACMLGIDELPVSNPQFSVVRPGPWSI